MNNAYFDPLLLGLSEEPEPAAAQAAAPQGPNPAPAFHVSRLSKTYETASGTTLALTGVDLDIPVGGFVSIVGASGCGKSTLLKILAGLEEASEGVVLREGRELDGPSREVSIGFQEHVLFPWLSIERNVMLPTEIQGLDPQASRERVQALLRMSGLSDFAKRKPAELSGGMKMRAALCRALATDPRVLLLDEPFGALDALTREELSLELLRLWERDRMTALLITHDIDEAVLLSDTVVVMSPRPGRIVDVIPIDLPRPRNEETASLPRFAQLTQRIRKLIFSPRQEAA
jgi:NitT/TauT family transport system ATP-binding protein